MNKEMLKNYDEWLKRSPAEIIVAVKAAGGWKAVFPEKLPLWAHRVRNFFNYEPLYLKRLNKAESNVFLDKLPKNFSIFQSKDKIIQAFALSGDVYRDQFNKIWYQMSPGATIYHYGSDPKSPELDAAGVTLKGQKFTPIFKLISPDGTGGSCETIIRNPQIDKWWSGAIPTTAIGNSNIGAVGSIETISHRIVEHPWYQGSYNYSETVVVGNDLHEKNDVEPHKKNKFMGVYVNPLDRSELLSLRKFPKIDATGKLLANQV
jgi:hypothetical protein